MATRSQWLIRAAILLLVIIVLAIGIIASGVFDPQPAGTLQWQQSGQQMSIPPTSREIIWLDDMIPDSTITIRMTGALHSGDEDSGYGLVFGDEDAYTAVAVSPLGYLAIWETSIQSGDLIDDFLLQWQTWPHVKRSLEENEVWVDVSSDRAAVRVNREWLWEGEISNEAGRIGLVGESFADSAVFDFTKVELFANNSG